MIMNIGLRLDLLKCYKYLHVTFSYVAMQMRIILINHVKSISLFSLIFHTSSFIDVKQTHLKFLKLIMWLMQTDELNKLFDKQVQFINCNQ